MPKIQSVIPLLVYEDIERAHDFLVDAFGFGAGGVRRDGDGQVVHGEVVAGDAPIWLHRVTPEHELASPHSMNAQTGGLVVHSTTSTRISSMPAPPARTSTASPSTRSTANGSTACATPRATAGGSRRR